MGLQEKALEHVFEILKTINSYACYLKLSDVLETCGVDNASRQRILSAYNESYNKTVHAPIIAAREWIKAIREGDLT